jgi:hypothetical protein
MTTLAAAKVKATEAGHATVFNRFTQPNNPNTKSLTNRATRENIQIVLDSCPKK